MEISMKEMFDSGYLINTPERKASWGIFFYFRNDAQSRPMQWPLLPACPTHVTMPEMKTVSDQFGPPFGPPLPVP